MCDADILQGEQFWEEVRSETGINLPMHVRKMLHFNGLDNPVAFGGITPQIIDGVETYARDVLKEILDPNEDLQLCYGPYHRIPEKFQFNTGERMMILKLVQLLANKSLDFWRPKKENILTIRQENVRRTGAQKMATLTMDGHNNIELERKTLTNKIKNAANNFFGKEDIQEQGVVRRISVNDLSVVVEVNEQYEGENLPQSLSYRAKIKCIFCESHVQLSKVPATMKNSSRWVVTNYERHLKSCCNKKRKSPVAGDASQSILARITKKLKRDTQSEEIPTTSESLGSRFTELEKCTETAKALQFPSTELTEVQEVPQMQHNQPDSLQCAIAAPLEPLIDSPFQPALHLQHSTSFSSTLRQSLNLMNNYESGED